MYLEMNFGKNKGQTIRQLQFKFDPLSTKSAKICLFHERWIKNFWPPTIWLVIHYIWLNILENWFGPNWQQIFGRFFIKKLILGTWKMKNEIFVQIKWKLSLETLFAIPRCTLVHNMRSFEQTMPWMWP